MKEIKLSQHGKNKEHNFVAIVDDEDFDALNKYAWAVSKQGNSFYAHRLEDKKVVSMHRQIMGISDTHILVDHRNRNGLDNQRNNLRQCNKSQNGKNRIAGKGSTSKYLGVSLFKARNKWQSSISVDGKSIYLGLFHDETIAAIIYNDAARKYNGEFASINNI